MGNISSSCFIQDSNPTKMAKIIDAQGTIRKVELPVTAAEIMLEEPGHIITSVEDLKRTRSVVAMRADDELLMGKVYVLIPMGRVHFKVKEADIAIIEAACSGKKRRKSGARVSPVVAEVMEESKVEVLGDRCMMKEKKWSPVLESISEVL